MTTVVGRGHEVAFYVILAAVLAVAALIGVAWAAGFGDVWDVLSNPSWPWLGVALGAEVVAYVGYSGGAGIVEALLPFALS